MSAEQPAAPCVAADDDSIARDSPQSSQGDIKEAHELDSKKAKDPSSNEHGSKEADEQDFKVADEQGPKETDEQSSKEADEQGSKEAEEVSLILTDLGLPATAPFAEITQDGVPTAARRGRSTTLTPTLARGQSLNADDMQKASFDPLSDPSTLEKHLTSQEDAQTSDVANMPSGLLSPVPEDAPTEIDPTQTGFTTWLTSTIGNGMGKLGGLFTAPVEDEDAAANDGPRASVIRNSLSTDEMKMEDPARAEEQQELGAFLMSFKDQYGSRSGNASRGGSDGTPGSGDDVLSAVGSVTTVQTDRNWRGDRVGKDKERRDSTASTGGSRKIGQPRAIPRKRSFFARVAARWTAPKDQNRVEFELYAIRLKKANAELEKNIESRGKEMKTIRGEQKADTKRWRKYAEIDLENMARTYYENRLLQSATQTQVDSIRLELIAEKINQVQAVLDGMKIEDLKGMPLFDDEGCFYAPAKIPLPDASKPLQESLNAMDGVVSQLEDGYKARQREAEQKVADGVRKVKFESLIHHAYEKRVESRVADKSNAFHYHPPDDKGKQVEFNCLLIDERHSEGQLLKKWRQRVEKTRIAAPVLTQFLDYIANFIVKKYGLKPEHKGALELYIGRLVYPRIMGEDRVPIMQSLRTDRELEHDEEFARKCLWMRSLSQTDIGITPTFQKKMTEDEQFQFLSISSHLTAKAISKARLKEVRNLYPYASAVLALHTAKRHCVPADLLHCFLETIRRIHKGASAYALPKKTQLTADDLFPIIVWVVVHSQLVDINMRLGHMERCLKNSVKHFGEVGICLSLIEAAVGYICRLTPEQFEEDNRRAREKGLS